MCAIAGYLGLGSPGNLEAMAAAMAHRGPDGEGFFSDPSAAIGLAHRRLSIIDPTAAAAQPMVSCGGRYRVVFNGEIYNFREIARELIAAGYEFNVNSDTAVLGPLYDRYETQAFGRLNGIFAIAIWDANRRELVVARDGFGVKPLYYAKARGLFAFASELKALLTFPSIAGKLDVAALLDYLVNLWSPGCSTPFQNIHKLLPGHFIRARLDAFEIVRWYAPPLGRSELSRRNDIGSIGQNLRDAFDRAVTRQCLSDVPIGAFLSGGVDSSAVVASMVKSANPPKRTYCIAFDGPSMLDEGFGDDFAHARMLADRLSVPLTKIAVQEPGAEELASLPFMLDEPQADPAALYVAAIAKAARRDGIKVLLAGTGGDDILSGYRRHRLAALRDRLAAWRILIPAGVLRAS
ncbi:MAG TPA: asparagine synthase (glutamine-hydrolyzing), partial [Hyphomicrobiales bacterium]|nr:asparagine synthase (glutamine-hydrolyzing) [Hyphomicrobiales bacterium]